MTPLDHLIAHQMGEQSRRLALAALAAAGVGAGAVVLLGLSGWFITGAALAGAAGLVAAHAFNVLLPSAMIRLLAIVRTAARYGERVSSHEAALQALARLRPRLFRGLASGPPARALALGSGEASSRFIQDVDALQTLFIRRSAPWMAGAGAVAALSLTALASPWAAVAVAVGLGASVLASHRMARSLGPVGRRRLAAMGGFKNRIAAHQASAAELRAYGLETWAISDVMRRADHHDGLKIEIETTAARLGLVQAGIIAAVVIGVAIAARGAELPLAALAILSAVMGLDATAGLSVAARDRGEAEAARTRLSPLIVEDVQPVAAPDAALSLRFGVDQTLVAGQRLGITGPSGGGKTTAIERLMGLRGSSRPDPAHRSRFAYAAQQVQLLDGSIRENLLLAAQTATEAELWRALDDADLGDRIRAAPHGLDTRVGHDGMRLSGGERRRLTLARAYLRDAPWLVLDEPTEGLDVATERRVVERLALRLDRTVQGLILVSHRPEPLAMCDRWLTIDGQTAAGAVRVAPAPALVRSLRPRAPKAVAAARSEAR